jgi:hypothetical protein|tara:strand:- start:364 stop:1218 length:855 start_codon:yes stop_codon:yes gene_type:complete
MKKIETLVEDIYKLFNFSRIDKDEKEVDALIDNFGEMLKVHVKEFMYSEPRGNGYLRLSAIGKPTRQIWYDINTETEEKLPPSTRIKFLYGYILEELLLLCASVAGHTVEAQQKEVTVEGVVGHQDAIIDGVLVDCKSASSYSFKKFESNTIADDDPFGYMAQISAYSQANGIDKAAFLVIDKSTGKICLTPVHSMEMINAGERVKYLKKTVAEDTVPDRCYDAIPDGKSGNLKLPVGCAYCRHKIMCWSDANQGKGLRTFKYSNGNRDLVQVTKTPDVQEIIN